MKILAQAQVESGSDVQYIVFDWSPKFVATLQAYQALILAQPLLQNDKGFCYIAINGWHCTLLEDIYITIACDGLVQAVDYLDHGPSSAEYFILDDTVDVERGVTKSRVSVATVCVEATHFYWEVYAEYETGTIESPRIKIPPRTADA